MDNWEHKSETMLCKTCMFFCNYRCRHSAPTLKGWPAVYPNDWCGAHKLDKNMMATLMGLRENKKPLPTPMPSPGVRYDGKKDEKDLEYERKEKVSLGGRI